MNVKLSRDMENYIRNLVSTGQYGSETDVLKEALDLHRGHLEKRDLENRLEIALQEVENGEGIDADDAFFDGLKQGILARRAK